MEDRVERLENEIYGNGRAGLKEEVAKLRQALKLATWVAGVIGALMLADFSTRFFGISSYQEDVKEIRLLLQGMNHAKSIQGDTR